MQPCLGKLQLVVLLASPFEDRATHSVLIPISFVQSLYLYQQSFVFQKIPLGGIHFEDNWLPIFTQQMDSCLSEDRGGPLSFETTSTQSYFKQLPWSRQVHQGIHKRSRPVISSFYGYPETEGERPPLLRAHSGFDGSVLSSYLLSEIRDDALSTLGDVVKSNGLVRSQSYPLEGFLNATGNYGEKITKSPSNSTERGLCAKNECLGSKYTSADPQNSEVGAVLFQPMVVEVRQSQQQEKIEITTTEVEAAQPISGASLLVDITMEHVAESSSIIEPGNSSENAALPLESNVSCADSMDFLQGEGGPSVAVVRSNLPIHCLVARQCPPGSKVLTCGRRREMEDMASVVPSFAALPCGMMGMCCCGNDPAKQTASDLHFFGIYDGHGGSQASLYCKQRFHLLLAEELSALDSAHDDHDELGHELTTKWKKTMTDCFSKIDKEVGGVCPNGICDDEALEGTCTSCEDAIAPENVGTTAVVAVVGSCQIVIANCGDSRAVLSRGGKAIALSTDHKPEREDETSRIESAGGRVICWDGYRVGGFLALSRAIGDRYLKRYVISEPEVTCVQRGSEDEVLILASDGLWDVLSNDYACEVARKALLVARKKRENRTFSPGEDPAAAAVAALLVKLAYGKGSKDNISVVVVDLKS